MQIYILPHIWCNRRRNFSLTKKRALSYNIQKCCNKTLAIFKLDPTQSNMLQHVATGWPNASNTRHYFIVFILFFILQEIVAMLSLKPGQKVLDVGCGIGGSGFYMVKVWLDPFFLSLVEKAGYIRVQSSEHRAKPAKAVTPSAKLYCVQPFSGILSSFFLWIESEISEQVRWQVATEEPNKGFWTCQVPYVMLS